MKTKFITTYNVTDERNKKFGTTNNMESMTQQSDAKDADINVIMGRYSQTGQLPQLIDPAKYGDYTTAPDFREAQEILKNARDMFAEVPAQVRQRFHNDPAEFLDFIHKEENLPELRRMGLAVPEQEEPPRYEQRDPYENQRRPRYDDSTGIIPDDEDEGNGNRSERQGNAGPRGQQGGQGGQGRQGLPDRKNEPEGGKGGSRRS